MKKIIAGAAIGAVFTVVALIIAEEYKRWRASGGCDCKGVEDDEKVVYVTPEQDPMTTARQLRDQMREAEAIAFERDQLDHTLATLDQQPYPSPKMA